MEHHRLSDMAKRFGLSYENAHRSLSDVLLTEKCYEQMHKDVLAQFGEENSFVGSFTRHQIRNRVADIIVDETKNNPDCPLYKKNCVFTGKLDKFTRSEAMQIVADLGGFVEDNVTKKTNYLILGNNDYCTSLKDGKSSKQKKAEKSKLNGQDIEIIPETVFYDMIGEEA